MFASGFSGQSRNLASKILTQTDLTWMENNFAS